MKIKLFLFLMLFFLVNGKLSLSARQEPFLKERREMVESQIKRRDISNPDILEAMLSVPRHEFVPASQKRQAYQDRPLPIGHGQTISQPYIVAVMTSKLNLDSQSVVLEIGTGSGYHAAVISEIAKKVYTIEIIAPLGNKAASRFEKLKYNNIEVKIKDGYHGWQEKAPYDAIVVTAAASHIPPPLIEQLKPGGTMVIPVGGVFQVQRLMLINKEKDGTLKSKNLMPVRFVPLTRNKN